LAGVSDKRPKKGDRISRAPSLASHPAVADQDQDEDEAGDRLEDDDENDDHAMPANLFPAPRKPEQRSCSKCGAKGEMMRWWTSDPDCLPACWYGCDFDKLNPSALEIVPRCASYRMRRCPRCYRTTGSKLADAELERHLPGPGDANVAHCPAMNGPKVPARALKDLLKGKEKGDRTPESGSPRGARKAPRV
jgi:hypothetical protein